MSCGVGCRHSLDLAFLWLWHRPAAVAPIRHLAWEPPYATGVALKKINKVIIDMYVFMDILLIDLDLVLLLFFFPSSLVLFSCGLMTISGVVFGLLFLCVCVCVCVCVCIYCRFLVCSYHRFWYRNLSIYLSSIYPSSIYHLPIYMFRIVFSYWSLNCKCMHLYPSLLMISGFGSIFVCG